MKRLLLLGAFASLMLSPCVAAAQSSMSGVGPHGWDYYLGTWTCTNGTASSVSGSSTATVTITSTDSGLFFRAKGQGYDQSGYVVYSAKAKTWANPTAYSDGSYSFESSSQSGKKTTWTGTYYNAASGTTVQERDTYTLSPGRYTDLNQTKSGGVWKMTGNSTCTKS